MSKAVIDLVNSKEQVVFGSAVIVKHIQGIVGGRALDMSEFKDKVIKAGHIIVKKSDGNYAPLGVTSNKYNEISDEKYVGILEHSMDAKKPSAAILTWGVVNEKCLPYPLENQSGSIKEAFTKACPHIDFIEDEEN